MCMNQRRLIALFMDCRSCQDSEDEGDAMYHCLSGLDATGTPENTARFANPMLVNRKE